MKALISRLNLFTVILFLAVIASFLQLDYMGRSIFSEVFSTYWVQSSNWLSNEACAVIGCGTETVKQVAPAMVGFKPERIVMGSVNIDLPVVSVPLENGTWDVRPHVANF